MKVYQLSNSTSYSNKSPQWSQHGEREFITKADVTSFVNIIETQGVKDFKPTKGQSIYTGKLSNIPRFKLKAYIEKYDLHKTSKMESADYIFISRKLYNEYLGGFSKKDLKSYIFASKTYGEYFINKFFHTDATMGPTHQYVKTKIDFNLSPDSYFLLEFKEWAKYQQTIEYTDFYNVSNIDGIVCDRYSWKKLGELIQYLKLSPNQKIIYDEDVLETFNTGGIELTSEYVDTILSMFNSKEEDNRKLGFEMLSNIDLQNDLNLVKLMFILNTVHNKGINPEIYSRSNTNLKALLSYLSIRKFVWNKGWQDMILSSITNSTEPVVLEMVRKSTVEYVNNLLGKQILADVTLLK
jgi:hypothetical protein